MSTTYATDIYPGNGSETEFDLTFQFISRDHINVVIIAGADGAETVLTVIETGTPAGNEYRWENDTRIKVGTAPTSDQKIRIRRDTPENQQLVPWSDGSYLLSEDLNTSDLQWLYGLQELEDKFGLLSTTAIKYLGAIDLTVDEAPAAPTGGDFFINTGSGSVLPSWIGIAGDAVVGAEQVIYSALLSEWQIFAVPSSQQGVVQVTGASPIAIDSTDTQRPEVSIAAATNAAAGSMSAADKAKIDGIPADIDSKFVEVTGDTMTGDLIVETKIGIGTSNPQAALDVTSTGDEAKVLRLGTERPWDFVQKLSGASARLALQSSANGKVFTINGASGTEVSAFLVDENQLDNSRVYLCHDGGRVGVGTDAPQALLHVNGKALSASTTSSDIDRTLVTKDYVDSIAPGGVTQIVAGSNVTISPSSGTGVVTVNSLGGGGSGDTTKADIYGTSKAWGSLNGNGSLIEGMNVTTSRISTGLYQINFNAPMPDSLYTITTGDSSGFGLAIVSKTVSGFQIAAVSGGSRANTGVNFAVHNNEPAEIIVGSGSVSKTNLYGTAKACGQVNLDGVLKSGFGCTVSTTVMPDGTTVAAADGIRWVTFNSPLSSSAFTVTSSNSGLSAGGNWDITAANKSTQGFKVIVKSGNGTDVNQGFDFTVFDGEPAEVALTSFGDVINVNSGLSAWGFVNNGALQNGLNISTSVSNPLVGVYDLTFINPMPDSHYSVVATAGLEVSVNATNCSVAIKTPSGFRVVINKVDDGANVNQSFQFQVAGTNSLPPRGGTGADAWANCTPSALVSAFNIQTFTKKNTGSYGLTFITPMPTNTYSVVASSTSTAGRLLNIVNKTTTGFDVVSRSNSTDALTDGGFGVTVNCTNATLPTSFTTEQIQSVLDFINVYNPAGVAKAWGSINSGGTQANSYNIASVTNSSTGVYTIKFYNPMPSAYYSVSTSITSYTYAVARPTNKTANGFTMRTLYSNGGTPTLGAYAFDFQVFGR